MKGCWVGTDNHWMSDSLAFSSQHNNHRLWITTLPTTEADRCSAAEPGLAGSFLRSFIYPHKTPETEMTEFNLFKQAKTLFIGYNFVKK